jgi:predicted nucleotide-binding protein (sugar kinase/HSP70/actin superfamily)
MRVGVPRALSYYRDFVPWRTFLAKLGVDVLVSPPATRETLEAGITYTVPEACLPLKLFCGQVRALVGRCDALLVPSVRRYAAGATNCAELIGLPDILRAVMDDLPPLIAPQVDLSGGLRSFVGLALQVGTEFTLSPILIRDAAMMAWDSYTRTRADLEAGRATPADLWDDGETAPTLPPARPGAVRVAVVGHPYNLYDPYVNHRLLDRLSGLGVTVQTPETLAARPGDGYWAFEYEFVGAAELAVRRRSADGLIAVMAFGCGPDGVMQEKVRATGASAGMPVMVLNLDEHAGAAGIVTRLEAFVDMLRWRRHRHGPVPGD